jgi:hypothetical protein
MKYAGFFYFQTVKKLTKKKKTKDVREVNFGNLTFVSSVTRMLRYVFNERQ